MGELLTELKASAERLTGARKPPSAGEASPPSAGSGTMNFGAVHLLGPSKLFARLHPLVSSVSRET